MLDYMIYIYSLDSEECVLTNFDEIVPMKTDTLKRLIRRVKCNTFLILLIKFSRLLKIRHLVTRIDTNHLCNLSCKMCYFNSKSEQRKPEMDLPTFKKVAKETFPQTRFLYLSCFAEPFCSKNIIEFVKIAKHTYKVPFVSLTTNGILTCQHTEEIGKCGLDEIVFSIAGGQKDTYEYIQQGAIWEKFWSNLDIIYSHLKIHGFTKPIFRINYVLNRQSVMEVKNIIPLIKKYGIRSVNIRELIRFRDIDESFYEEFRLHTEDEHLIREALAEFRNNGIEVSDSLQCSRHEKFPVSKKNPCIQPYFSVFIDSAAHIKFCLFQEWKHSLKTHTLKEIFTSDLNTQFLDSLKNSSTAKCVTDCSFYTTRESIQ